MANFLKNCEFKESVHVQGDVEWGNIQRIGGQKSRLADYIIGAIFIPYFWARIISFFPLKK